MDSNNQSAPAAISWIYSFSRLVLGLYRSAVSVFAEKRSNGFAMHYLKAHTCYDDAGEIDKNIIISGIRSYVYRSSYRSI